LLDQEETHLTPKLDKRFLLLLPLSEEKVAAEGLAEGFFCQEGGELAAALVKGTLWCSMHEKVFEAENG